MKSNILSGLTVAQALVPEAIAFALVARVNPLVGLYAAFMCLTTSSTTVVMVALVVQHGIEYLSAAVVLMGILQIPTGCQHHLESEADMLNLEGRFGLHCRKCDNQCF